MRGILFFAALLLLMRFGSGVSLSSASGATVGSLALGVALGVLPLLGFIGLFRSFGRWHRGFHARMKAGGLPLRSRNSDH